jgi:hypothetical protein
MRVPRVNERVKESPASALRAMFAGIGSLLFVRDKIKSKPADQTAPETEVAAPETTAERATSAEPEEATAPETTVAETSAAAAEAAPETVTAEPETVTAEPETVTAEPETVTAESSAGPESAALPLPNYDELSIASLRARLRNLSADQLTVLISYEKSHAERADVISMFERRIAKLAEA